MKKFQLLSFALVTMLAFTFASCEKENSCELLGNCEEAALISPANLENPFDAIGALHNDGLAFLRKTYQSEIEAEGAASPSKAERYTFMRSLEFSSGSPDLYMNLRASFRLNGDEELLGSFNFADYHKWLNMADIDPETREALRAAIASVMRTEPGTVETTNEIISAIKEQEHRFLTRDDSPSRSFALVFFSVWRHSNHYWMGGENGEPVPAKAKWWHIALADAACGAVGFALGGPAGGVGLGVGASKVVGGLD